MSRLNDQPPDLFGYITILMRRVWLVLSVAALVTLAAVYFSLQQTPTYHATSEVLLKYQNLAGALSGIQDYSTVYQDASRIAETQARVARAPVVAERVLRTARVTDRSADELLGASTVTVDSEADVLAFGVTDTDPEVAQKLASEYARQFVKRRLELDTEAVVLARRGIEERLADLRRTGREDTQLYDQLAENQQQLRTMETLQTSNATLLRAAGDGTQVAPRPFRNGVLGALLGLVLGVGFAFLAHALDTRVRSAEEVASTLGLPLLGRVPELGRRRRQKGLAMLAEPNGSHAEVFRLLRTNVEFSMVDRPFEMLLVTSALEGEGKSTTAANLAIAFARTGRRVALVEADLRAPSLGRFFQAPPGPGLTDVALGHVGLDDALLPVALPGEDEQSVYDSADANGKGGGKGVLALLLSGPLPPNPGEFVASTALQHVFGQLRLRFDIVILDTTPMLGVGDALALTGRVDGILVVARVTSLRRPILREVQRVLSVSPAPVLGVVVTGAQGQATYGYGYGYGSTYGRRGAPAPSAAPRERQAS